MSSPIILSVLTALSWATTGIFIKLLDRTIDSYVLIWYRFVIASFFLFLIGRGFKKRQHGRSFKSLLLSVLMTGYYASATVSFQYASVPEAALCIALSPIYTIALRLFSKERVEALEYWSCITALIGTSIFLYSGSPSHNGSSYFGVLLAMLAGALKALYSFMVWTISAKGSKEETPSPLLLTLDTLIIGALVFSPVSLPLMVKNSNSAYSFAMIVCLGLISTAIPTLTNSLASSRVNPTVHTLICVSTPLLATVLSVIVLKETVNPIGAFGMLLALVGIVLSAGKKKEGVATKPLPVKT